MKKKITIAVLAGGDSAEREVSLQSGEAVARALRQKGFAVLRFDPKNELPKFLAAQNKIDVVFPALHGRGGEDGEIQKLLEKLKIPFVGSNVQGMQNSFDKITAKKIYRRNKLPVARDQIFPKDSAAKLKLKLPVFVKPADEGSSFGASLVQQESEFAPALRRAWKFGHALVEEYLRGTEISVGVLQNSNPSHSGQADLTALPSIEICPKKKFFDFAAKYDSKFCEEICPARIPPLLEKKVRRLAEKAHRVLQLKDLSRTDFILVGKKIYLLETNTLPGFTANSLLPKEAAAAGIPFPDLVEKLIRLPLRGKDRKDDKEP
ncbi:D-alanine--D-alanine ligase [Candidatus Gracilibacteria bacterium]|nr:D-alanine--D-alanine ligase [Candidatus Gracilibacteria bacterium]MCF7856716.1 D-alanine--D-alanine ligase [Candidatus Gracilibacteria bacterium]MCF7897022.1 D-alanine--D-alanine ligase [Candidatus Gracilibacteria bacterium]